MRVVYLYLFLLAGAVGTTHAQWDVLNKVRDWFTGMRQQVMSRIFNSENFKAYNSTYKELLARGNLSSLSVEEARALPTNLWRKYGALPLLSLRDNTRNLVAPYLSQRIKDEMNLLQRVNITIPQAIDRLRSLLRDTTASRVEVNMLLEQLGNSWDWMEANITSLKPILFYLPISMLTNLRDVPTITRLNDEVRQCTDNSGSRSESCPSQQEAKGDVMTVRAQYMLSLRAWLIEKTYGDPRNWDRDTFAKMTDLSILPDAVFLRLQPEVLLTRKDEILTMLRSKASKVRSLGRYIVEKVFMKENVRRSTDNPPPSVSQTEVDRIKAVISPLRSAGLMQFVYATDLPNEVLDADNRLIRNELDTSTTTALQSGGIDALVLENGIQGLFNYTSPFTSEQVRNLGMNRLALASGLMLNRTLRTFSISADDFRRLSTTIQNTVGSTAKSKLMLIKNKVFEVASGGGSSLDISYVPDELLDVAPMRYLDAMSSENRMNVLGRNTSFNTGQMATLISGIGSGQLSSISGNAKEAIPTNVYKDLNKDGLKPAAVGMPPSSKLGLMTADKAFKNGVNMNADANAAMFLQGQDAKNIPPSDIVQQLEYMKDTFPTRQACSVLKNIYVNYSATEMMTQSEEEVFQLLTPSAIELMPICVTAAFGQDRLRRLDDVSKITLLDRLVANRRMALTYASLSRSDIQTIVEEGLNAKGRPSVLTGADVNMYGEILLFFPTDLLNSMTSEGAPVALGIFNNLAASVLMPCLDGGRRAAIGNMITKFKGDDPQTWRQMSGLCCLLYTLPSGTLSRIPRGALMSCRCHIADRAQHAPENEARQMECRNFIGGDYDAEVWQRENVRRVQAWAALDVLDPYTIPNYNPNGRKKRAVSDVALCNRASVSGADDISNGELSNAPTDVLMECLGALGSRYMDAGKAQILANKVRETLSTRSWSSLTNDLMRDMNFIMKGIPANEIRDLPRLAPPNDFSDTVTVLGNEKMMFSDEQLRAYADKVLTTWRSLADMSDKQLAMYNRLLCAANASLINTLSPDRVGNALTYLGVTLEGCSRDDVLTPLALKAMAYYPYNPNKAQVREMGVVFAGITYDKIAGRDASSFTGLTPAALRAMSGEAIHAMSPEQLRSLSYTTAMAMSGGVRDSLSGEQKAALNEAITGNGTSRRELSTAAALLSLLLMVVAS
ncbi:uncharacterized protein LOC108676246 isoform X2 [Hyalella azteca]|uniref:Uncharacterized protein LOC108676246 isoform X2 n=1 Tax=Hyalella azteca TaxID=294128 RepID=A0A8B7P193_HYAAZ|nr:uncharacterized protein LOC108676246 isoform X2 [Hyalella azteca]